jgi:hypothetical protein
MKSPILSQAAIGCIELIGGVAELSHQIDCLLDISTSSFSSFYERREDGPARLVLLLKP